MSQILIIHNALDQHESEMIQSENVLKKFLEIRVKHPQARIFKGFQPSAECDVTPTRDDKASIARLLESNDDFCIVTYSGELASAVTWVATKLLGQAVKALVKMPNLNNAGTSTGSSNNNLSNPENKQRIKERVPFILGAPKAIPDLFANPIRYFKDGIEVEELLLCVCENYVKLSNFKEGDTPIREISGKSITAYGLNQSIIGTENIYKWGDTFTEAPLVAKQNNSVNGQTLLSPNSTRSERSDIYFQYPNLIKALSDKSAGDFEAFNLNESILIEGANFGIADLAITGSVQIDNAAETISITSSQTALNYADYRKINVTAMLITDPVSGQLDLAGLYDIENINYVAGKYIVKLTDPTSTNANFANLTTVATTNISANLTANTANIFLDGEYIVTSVDRANRLISIATPSAINTDWDKLIDLTGQQTPTARVKLRGSQSNFIGWFTTDSPLAKGLLLNFRAGNGIYRGSEDKTVTIEAEYQQVVNNVPTGQIFKKSVTLNGRKNNRDAVGASLWIDLPFTGAVRFRARRTNDNGDADDLVDETKFYLAYAYHKLEKLVYDNRVLIRARTVATLNATSQDSRQLNCIAESLVYSYRNGVKSANRVTSRNIADLAIDVALHPKIGRRTESEIDFDRIYAAVDELIAYFGSDKMAEFNYTLDSTNTSFEEILRMMGFVTGCHDRRVNRKTYFDFESPESLPILLFNHRNKQPQTEVRTYNLTVDNQYDGIELTYVDSTSGWIEKTLKLPNDLIKNPKKVEGTGIIYTQQAHVIGWREWNKLKFSRIFVKFGAYAESDYAFVGDNILTTDDVRIGDCTSGEIRKYTGLEIEVSQPYIFDVSKQYVIHLQMKSGYIDVIKVSQGSDDYHFLLERPAVENFVIDGQVKTVYSVTTDQQLKAQRFIVSKKSSQQIFENEITAYNFDDRFYRNDKDIINNLI